MPDMLVEVVLVLVAVAVYFTYWIKYTYSFFEKYNIQYDKPIPIVGSMGEVVFGQKNMFDKLQDLYNQFNFGVAGIFEMKTPVFLIRNPELVNQMMVKDFEHFVNHRTCFTGDYDGLLVDSLVSLTDQKWRDMRATLTPGYTGSKLKAMFEFMRETAKESTLSLKEEMRDGRTDIDLGEYFMGYANDVIATTAFGFKINSMKVKDNHFFKMGKSVLGNFGPLVVLKFCLLTNFTKVARFFRISILSRKTHLYFMRLVIGAMKQRFEQKIFRPDMINLLMEARGMDVQGNQSSSCSQKWSDTEIAAQCFFFFLSGFDSVSTLLCFISHELMENQSIQEKLRDEIKGVLEELNGNQLTYEILNSMKYMDCVVSEALRKWPPNSMTDRVCTKSIEIQDPETGERIELTPGDKVWFPIVGIHRDPKNFVDPFKFDPERFNEENKGNINPNTFIPFGAGPRMCIAHRFAVMEIKVMVFYMFSEIQVKMSEKSCVPMKLDPATCLTFPKNGFWVKLLDSKK
ncbi:hypothetical protein ACFFRR_000598 [Megaselia abdita]